jgi:hypothetical protein
MTKAFGVVCGIALVLLLLVPTGNPEPTPSPINATIISKSNDVNQAFTTYKRLWVQLTQDAAAKLDSKEFTTEQEVWDFLASGQEPARKIAFDKVAAKEQKTFEDAGGWTPELHSSILKGYGK